MTRRPPQADSHSTDLHEEIVEVIPNLRAFARSLVSNPAQADDLVQGALARALANLDKFEAGTNLRAWMFTILRNLYYSELRKRRREVEDVDGGYAATLSSQPNQIPALELKDFRRALASLPAEQREALILIGASGFSYEDAARICGCAIGTMKSRVNRGRNRLADLLQIDSPDDLGGDKSMTTLLEGKQALPAGR
ncbi:MAG: sigma-70 family RNA polymerase sigma factor [Kiloniellaceae bacterium]